MEAFLFAPTCDMQRAGKEQILCYFLARKLYSLINVRWRRGSGSSIGRTSVLCLEMCDYHEVRLRSASGPYYIQ